MEAILCPEGTGLSSEKFSVVLSGRNLVPREVPLQQGTQSLRYSIYDTSNRIIINIIIIMVVYNYKIIIKLTTNYIIAMKLSMLVN